MIIFRCYNNDSCPSGSIPQQFCAILANLMATMVIRSATKSGDVSGIASVAASIITVL